MEHPPTASFSTVWWATPSSDNAEWDTLKSHQSFLTILNNLFIAYSNDRVYDDGQSVFHFFWSG